MFIFRGYSFAIILVGTLSSCSSFFGNKSISTEESPIKPESVVEKVEVIETKSVATSGKTEAVISSAQEKRDDEIHLRQARMMARMEEIEAELKRQREKIRLLEQGLLTGIAPDELKSPVDVKPSKKLVSSVSSEENPNLNVPMKPDVDAIDAAMDAASGKEKSSEKTGADSTYNTKMQLAKEHYQAGRFGLAIAELAGISREFGENSGEGELKLWLGRAYLGLREFSTARLEFEQYLKAWPTGEHSGQARVDLAKSYVGLGLKERARGELRRVMKDFKGQEISEIATAEFQRLQGGL